MCQKCSDIAKEAMSNGMPEKDVMDFLWEQTPFPVGEPFKEQTDKLLEISKRYTK